MPWPVKSPGFTAGEPTIPTATTEKRHRYSEPPGNAIFPNNLKHFNCPSNWSHLNVFVKQQCFDVGFEKANGENDKARIKVDNLDRVNSIAAEILATLDRIDNELEQEIPAGFSWRTC